MNRKTVGALAASLVMAGGVAMATAMPASAGQSASAQAKAVLDSAAVPAAANAWYVDAQSGAVVVEVSKHTAATKRFAANAAATGAEVRTVVTQPYTAYYDVRGGDAWYTDSWRCSVGFSATGPGGSKHFVTAGHCTERPATTAYGYNRVALGAVGGSTFGRKGDFGKVDVTSSQWVLKGTVKGASSDVAVTGSAEAPVGASICRSGSTTGWHCGVVQQKNVTVHYQGSGTVGGLTKTSVCAEPGDSGGSYISGSQAQGVTSGGSGNCRTGGTTFFNPVNEILGAYHLTLVTS
jgi:streptogrisin C